jgi:hypothetical protein
MSSLQLQAYEILKQKFTETEAKVVIEYIEQKVEHQVTQETKHNATKQDLAEIKSELSKTIYIVGLIQFIAIVGSVLAIVTFMLKK